MYCITEKGIITEAEFLHETLNLESSVYEVIRVKDGIALFLEDHYLRLKNSLNLSNTDFDFPYDEFKKKIGELISLNQKKEGNIKFVLSAENLELNWAFAFIPHSYPTQEDYASGVSVGLLSAERINPSAKIIQSNLRAKANQIITENRYYEVILVDKDGMITEGSRSNVFFVKDGVFYTAPASKILEGITRSKVLECLQKLNFKVVEESVYASQIKEFDAIFLTGTSPKVLPISRVENYIFETDSKLVRKLIDCYDLMILDYIEKEKYS